MQGSESSSQVHTRDKAVGYMRRTRDYYRALGYDKDYVWAHNDDVPFTQPNKPLAQMRIGLVTTTSPAGTTKQTVPSVWSAPTDVQPESMYTDNLAWDKITTHTNDTESFLPLRALGRLMEAGIIGSIASRYHGIPTEYSQRRTLDNDGPEIVQRIQQDGADAVLLVPL